MCVSVCLSVCLSVCGCVCVDVGVHMWVPHWGGMLCHIALPFAAQTSGTEHGVLAEAIFVELNKAYALFEESGAYNLY